jgi:hypothetical protein
MLPIVAGTLVKASTSSALAKLPVMLTVPEARVVLSRSAVVIAVLIAAAAPF